MVDVPKLIEYAALNLKWVTDDLSRLVEAGPSSNRALAEKAVKDALGQFAAASEAITKASLEVNKAHIKGRIDRDTQSDPLLRYIHHARHGQVHHFLRWDFQSACMTVGEVDAEKLIAACRASPGVHPAMVLMMQALGASSVEEMWEKSGQFAAPDAARAAEAGVPIADFRAHMGLTGFKYTNHRGEPFDIPEPNKHMGANCSTAAQNVFALGAKYYFQALREVATAAGLTVADLTVPASVRKHFEA